ncbi:capsular polysaccharide export protein, LipB/KpsS family [Geomonas propionica]|uniref:Capsule polysaccharide biosynthesis protein n=1 Tax=Geomonas propionica TaxID=2798582 RepID=A0ABS0YUV6_9BACT|nr:hypothetical protein [Geomonas propionica]MBJ6801711.1 hypothetical protein [Geomonas propionica]
MAMRLLCISTSKNTSAILQKITEQYRDEVEFLLHVGDKDSDLKASSMTRMTRTRAVGKTHVMDGQKFNGLLHSVITRDDFEKDISIFIDHLHRRDEKFCYKSHNLACMQDYLDYYYILFDVMAEKVIENNITHMLFFNVPHLAYDTILYQIGKSLGLKIVIVTQSLFPNKFFSMPSMDAYGSFEPKMHQAPPAHIEKNKEIDLFYMKNVKQEQGETGKVTAKAIGHILSFLAIKKPSYLANPVKLYDILKRTNDIYRRLPKWRDPFARFFHVNELEYFEHIIQYEKAEYDLDVPFVYFPLQLQPEMTTSALGGYFRDQALAIECLSSILPDNVKIYVKENPKQGAYNRGPLFYHRLRRIKNVVIVPSFANTHTLTDRSLFVCTITGTVGWEALIKGKKALIFGNTWYQSFPGVFKYGDSTSYDEIINYQIDHAELEQAFGALLSKCHDGVVDRHYTKLVPDYDAQKNDEGVCPLLMDLLRGKGGFTFGSGPA